MAKESDEELLELLEKLGRTIDFEEMLNTKPEKTVAELLAEIEEDEG